MYCSLDDRWSTKRNERKVEPLKAELSIDEAIFKYNLEGCVLRLSVAQIICMAHDSGLLGNFGFEETIGRLEVSLERKKQGCLSAR